MSSQAMLIAASATYKLCVVILQFRALHLRSTGTRTLLRAAASASLASSRLVPESSRAAGACSAAACPVLLTRSPPRATAQYLRALRGLDIQTTTCYKTKASHRAVSKQRITCYHSCSWHLRVPRGRLNYLAGQGARKGWGTRLSLTTGCQASAPAKRCGRTPPKTSSPAGAAAAVLGLSHSEKSGASSCGSAAWKGGGTRCLDRRASPRP